MRGDEWRGDRDVRPDRFVTPRRATDIARGAVDHTLNFLIPDAWCDGVVDLVLRVFDAAAPGQKSGAMHRTLRFVRVNPLRVYSVGINYTGAGLNLPAPTDADFATTFDYTRRVWPTGDVLFSGYTTIEFSESLAGTASEGCGDGFNSLLDELQDMRGDTDDLVYGLLPNGTPLTGVGGCGGSGAGTGMVGAGATAAHEAGHAVGRDHAPCDDSARCDSPLDTDDDFPNYGSYVSDSVGEFGFDVENNVVFDPATSRDFMGYSGTNWISPYTYAALMAKGDPSPSTGGCLCDGHRRWARRLGARGLRVGRGTTGRSRPARVDQAGGAGAVPSRARRRQGRRGLPVVHLRGLPAAPRCSHRLRGPHPRRQAQPPRLPAARTSLPLLRHRLRPGGARRSVPIKGEPDRLVVRRKGKNLEKVDFEAPVRLICDSGSTSDGDLHLKWEGPLGSGTLIWYLVQWADRDGTWRGLAPRTQETELRRPESASAGRRRTTIPHPDPGRRAAHHELVRPGDPGPSTRSHSVDVVVYDSPGSIGVLVTDPLVRQGALRPCGLVRRQGRRSCSWRSAPPSHSVERRRGASGSVRAGA